MPKAKPLNGEFWISDLKRLQARMGRLHDGRVYFYEAMQRADTFEQYLILAGRGRSSPRGRKDGPFSATQEFRYALKRGWISM